MPPSDWPSVPASWVVLAGSSSASRMAAREPPRSRRVGDVEQGHLQAAGGARPVGGLTEAEQQAVAGRVQVGGVAEQLELAGHPRPLRPGQVERVERVGLPEGHHVADRPDEADGVDPLGAPEPGDVTKGLWVEDGYWTSEPGRGGGTES